MIFRSSTPKPGSTADVDRRDRWMLWVDGAGGFMIIASPSVTIGGPASESEAMVSVQADLHRREASLQRQHGEYSIGAIDGTVEVGGQAVTGSVQLRSGESFVLAGTTTFAFQRPHPLSASARLTVGSRTRLRPHADGILLLDDTLVIGATDDCHIPAVHAEGTLVLVQRAGAWQCKATNGKATWQPLELGQRCDLLGVSMTMEQL